MFTGYEKKLCNIIIDNFDKIAELTTHTKQKRSEYINQLIINIGSKVSDGISADSESEETPQASLKRLHSLEVENFRGFSTKDEFDLDKQYILIYGSNGSGKSSFCEALEYSMLGYINEAIAKNVDIRQYTKNYITCKSNAPELKAVFTDEATPRKVVPNSNYHFCFIERSRIENFARFSASKPSDQSDYLGRLFGLSEFIDFINEFSSNIENYIDVVGKKQKKHEDESKSIAMRRDDIKSDKNNLSAIEKEAGLFIKGAIDVSSLIYTEKEELITKKIIDASGMISSEYDRCLEECPPTCKSEVAMAAYMSKYKAASMDDLISLLNTKSSSLDAELKKAVESEHDIQKNSELKNLIDELSAQYTQYGNTIKEYSEKQERISFKKLYEAALELEALVKDRCPLCETSLEETIKNPILNSREKLKDLGDIALLQEKKQKQLEALTVLSENAIASITKRNVMANKFNNSSFLKLPEDLTSGKVTATNLVNIETLIHDYCLSEEQNNLDIAVESDNQRIRNIKENRQKILDEKGIISGILTKIATNKSKIEGYKDNIAKWQKEIDMFDGQNVAILTEIEQEKLQVETNKQYVSAYKSLLKKLEDYRDCLPLKYLKELNELIKSIYNKINANDPDYEQIHEIKFPATSEERIIISFADNPSNELDALNILSEGHLRCLGLSILLAKNIKEESNILIMDDIVNAVDYDHRGGIRSLLLDSKYFPDSQIIILSHAEEFIRAIDNGIPKVKNGNLTNKYLFKADKQTRAFATQNMSEGLNYLLIAEKYLSDKNKKNALGECRRSLERSIKKLWMKWGKTCSMEISVKLKYPDAKPDLMMLVQALNAKVKKLENIDNKQKITDIFDYLLGLETTQRTVWSYLNEGIHDQPEDSEDFDEDIVKSILDKLVELDSVLEGVPK
jgi:energy-coupling factor transporter ATP-binding protein EcfA2